MNQLKFKAFNKKDGGMYDVYSIEFLQGGIKVQGTGIHIGNGWVTEDNGFKHECDVILLPYTGEKDINGEEAYSGHIVRAEFEAPDETFPAIGVINWCEERMQYIVNDTFGEKDSLMEWNGFEIIGHIHTNPELLK